MDVRVYLTGRIAVEVDGDVGLDERMLRARQDRLVFSYLIVNRSRAITREELATVMWPDERPVVWEMGISAVLSRLNDRLRGTAMAKTGVILMRTPGQIELQFPMEVWIDTEVAASAVDAAEGALRSGNHAAAFGPAAVAATITRRPFLPSDNGPWAVQQRTRLARQCVRALECLATVWLSTGEAVLAVEAAAEAAGLDPLRESSYRLLMLAHAAAGNAAEAVKSYHRLRHSLAEHLGTSPSEETEAVFLRVLG